MDPLDSRLKNILDDRLRDVFQAAANSFGWPGKKGQARVSGGLMHAHTVYRDPRLANLSAEELASLNSLTRKLVTAAEYGPHNQIQSNTAIEAVQSVEVASEQCESLSA